MTIRELQQEINLFRPALLLEAVVSRETRWRVERMLTVLLTGMAVVAVVLQLGAMIFELPEVLVDGALAVTLVVLASKLVTMAHDSFFFSYYFRGMQSILDPDDREAKKQKVSFELASVLFGTGPDDVTRDFIFSRYGFAVLRRVGIDDEAIKEFFTNRKKIVLSENIDVDSGSDGTYGLAEYIKALLKVDAEFLHLLATREILVTEMVAAATWTIALERASMRRRRFWSRDSLGRIPGIGKDWAFGGAYILEKYSHDISLREHFTSVGLLSGYGATEVKEIEAILSKKADANVLLVGDYTAGKLDILTEVARLIKAGKVLPPLEHKRLLVLDTDLLAATSKTKQLFESELIKIFNDAVRAGNIIVVFENFPSFMASAEAIGSNVASILDSYLSSSHVQIIALADNDSFHRVIEPNTLVLERFEKVTVDSTTEENTIAVLEDIILQYEAREGVFFTYQAVEEIAQSAERYFVDGVIPDKAIDLVNELVPEVLHERRRFITKKDVTRLVQAKTGIAVGKVTVTEKDKLLKLEELLHARIIGQHEAVKAIADAMRRARSGVQNESKPMGSFLFLGPTGVGKTETVKALASVFFGDEKAVLRLDMSEYTSNDALDRLIGSFSSNKPGILSSKLRERPYGVLLLDEFEKTSREVKDLFLQVLDEGFFSDMAGKRVNCRNHIIIATSNAGSERIVSLVKEGKDVRASREIIIDDIIKQGIFRPEFLNRFDGVIVFHPLSADDLREVASLMLENLKKRLAAKGMEFVITEDIITYLMKTGLDQKFGGRAMNRAIQEKIEGLIARKIISSDFKPGSRIELTAESLV